MEELLQTKKSEMLLPVFTISLFYLCALVLWVQTPIRPLCQAVLKLDVEFPSQSNQGNLVSNSRKRGTSKGAWWGITSIKTKGLALNLEPICPCFAPKQQLFPYCPFLLFCLISWRHKAEFAKSQPFPWQQMWCYDVLSWSKQNKQPSWIKEGVGALHSPKDALLKSFLADFIPIP